MGHAAAVGRRVRSPGRPAAGRRSAARAATARWAAAVVRRGAAAAAPGRTASPVVGGRTADAAVGPLSGVRCAAAAGNDARRGDEDESKGGANPVESGHGLP